MPFRQKPKKPRTFLNEAGLYDYALKALGRTMRTEAELRRLMKQRTEPGDSGLAIVDNVIARLKEHGYLDDKSFAAQAARQNLGELLLVFYDQYPHGFIFCTRQSRSCKSFGSGLP